MDIQFGSLSKPTKDALKDAGQTELFEKCIIALHLIDPGK